MGAHAVSVVRRGCRRAGWPDPGASARGGGGASQWRAAPAGATLRESRSPLGREPSRRARLAFACCSVPARRSASFRVFRSESRVAGPRQIFQCRGESSARDWMSKCPLAISAEPSFPKFLHSPLTLARVVLITDR